MCIGSDTPGRSVGRELSLTRSAHCHYAAKGEVDPRVRSYRERDLSKSVVKELSAFELCDMLLFKSREHKPIWQTHRSMTSTI